MCKVKNKHFENLEKIEFVITYACSGRCKHCSQGDHSASGEHIPSEIAADAVRKIAAEYEIKTVMAFGGEPLLYPDPVYAIMNAAKEMSIPHRQVITNGYFAKDSARVRAVAKGLAAAGVNDLLISVDAFHGEHIPQEAVMEFAREAAALAIPIRLQPAWLVSREADNPYNRKTRECLAAFSEMNLPVSEGNIVFPEGSAKIYLAEYFENNIPENPYIEDPCNVKCISIEPSGAVFGRNICENDIMEIVKEYSPI